MATYFHGSSEIQAGGDGLQTLILMNPTTGYVGFSDRQQQQQQPPSQPPQQSLPAGNNNFVFFNSSNSPGGNSLNFIHAPPPPPPHIHQQNHYQQQQQLVGIPLTSPTNQSAASSQDHQGFLPRGVQYNNPYSHNFDHEVARETPRSQQGLSLRLSSQQPVYGSFRLADHEVSSQPHVTTISAAAAAASGGDGAAGASSSASGISNNVNGMQGVLLNSKYLKAAQELLDEVVNVNKGLKTTSDSGKHAKNIRESSSEIPAAATGESQSNRDNTGKLDNELTTTERQEIQMKKAKLVNMIDEVEQRYRQYHHQMQIVISWFEQASGIGSAKTYTALALQTISKQFRCLKDAILGQIRAASKKLGEEDSFGGKTEGSKLKFIDNQLRQQRALQQLGMVQHNAWRPQRGLPERSVSVLRAWLFEHFLHPYPKESDKFMLAKQTGLTRSQVSNWFINARVRLWKPMVEEMYTEEMKDQEKKGNVEKSGESENNQDSAVFKTTVTDSPEKTSSFENQNKTYISNQEHVFNQNIASPNSVSPSNQNHSGFNLIGSPEMESMTQGSPKKPRASVILHASSNVQSISMDENHADLSNGHLLLGGSTNFIEGFGSYPIAELGERFSAEQFQSPYSGNGFSLTLGLPQWENLTMPGSHQPFLHNQNIRMSRGVEIGDTAPTSNDSIGVYDNINIQDRKRLAGQMLQDFVA